MNAENQKIIIIIIGACLIITLIGTILIGIINGKLELITLFVGIVTTLVGILATALQGKKMTEKQEETLEQYYIDKAIQNDTEAIIGSMSFQNREEMEDYLENKTVQELIEEADTHTMGGEDVQQTKE